MIQVDFVYKRLNGRWYHGHKTFFNVNSAVRFLYAIGNSCNMVYDGFSCTDPEETAEINRRWNPR